MRLGGANNKRPLNWGRGHKRNKDPNYLNISVYDWSFAVVQSAQSLTHITKYPQNLDL